MTLFLALMLIILLCFVVWNLKLYVSITYRDQGQTQSLTITVATWKNIFHYAFTVPLKVVLKEGRVWVVANEPKEKHRFAAWIRRYLLHPRELLRFVHLLENIVDDYKNLVLLLLRRGKCEKLFWKTHVGRKDAAETGLVSGLLWTMKYSFIAYLLRYMPFRHKPLVQVEPHFQEERFSMELECIFSLPLGNLMNVLLTRFTKRSKEVG
ncbi:MAG: DUF2953 domain-containing protein [Sporomusaceae bacterium]|nr:DUF2953 domain-containing protein [Sporomusaceae bacterium]